MLRLTTGGSVGTTSFSTSFRVMKKVTITLPEGVARWFRVRTGSARSVSRGLGDLVEGLRSGEDEYGVAMKRFVERALQPRRLRWIDGRRPTREEVHDRAGLR